MRHTDTAVISMLCRGSSQQSTPAALESGRMHVKHCLVCMQVQFGQEASPEEQEALRSDCRTKLIAELVEAKWEEWGGRAANNIAWAHAVLGHGSPTIMSKVLTP